jgi:hypothetical protein
MVIRNRVGEKSKSSQVELALRAVESNYSSSDITVDDFDPSPTALGLDGAEESEMCPNGRCAAALDACIICGSRLCDDCA